MGFDPFNNKAKEKAQYALETAVENHEKQSEKLTNAFIVLQDNRQRLADKLREVENAINRFKNTPDSYQKDVQKLSVSIQHYEKLLNEAQEESANIARGAGAGAVAGVAAGGTVATFGGAGLTAVAMSLGTASTGTAVGALSGAAATNAALAWLGGGTLAAGGSGIAGGEALLALTGPIGWGIGGAIMLGSGLWARGKNAHAAEDMRADAVKVRAGTDAIRALIQEIKSHQELMIKVIEGLHAGILYVANFPGNFNSLSETQAQSLGSFRNLALAGEAVLNAKLGGNQKFEMNMHDYHKIDALSQDMAKSVKNDIQASLNYDEFVQAKVSSVRFVEDGLEVDLQDLTYGSGAKLESLQAFSDADNFSLLHDVQFHDDLIKVSFTKHNGEIYISRVERV
ncbi:hypothetical protein [Weissella confusa]|uniref:hypothetical protein n=1 Tax=Weissella confusa TaxID=1583 RepID=UPI001AEC6B08|nr:hypothetical protein [Weissella confusa]